MKTGSGCRCSGDFPAEALRLRPLDVATPTRSVRYSTTWRRQRRGYNGLKILNMVTVSTLGSLAANWLIPRLGSLRRQQPTLDVRVQIAEHRTDFLREDVDVAIRFGQGRYPGLRSDFLMHETLFPVCSAALMNDPERPI